MFTEQLTAGSYRRPPRMSNEAARQLFYLYVAGASKVGAFKNWEPPRLKTILRQCKEELPRSYSEFLEVKAPLSGTEIPLPTTLAREVSELIWNYGDARRHAAVFPLAKGVNQLPRLSSSPEFEFLTQSSALPEKVPSFGTVNFDSQKAGGLLRVPEEFGEDQPEMFGNFLGNWAARRMAKFEDTVLFTADGSATYKTRKGVGQTAVDAGCVLTLPQSKTSPENIGLNDLRYLRTLVDPNVLANGAYYLNMSNEQQLCSFNTSSSQTPYVAAVSPPRFDGFPIFWVGAMPLFDRLSHPGQIQVLFGDMSYWTLGLRAELVLFFAKALSSLVDEIRVKPIERFDIGLLGINAMAALKLAVS